MNLIEYKPTDYPSDLTDVQWEQIEEYFPQNGNSEHHKRSLINAVLYLVDNGIKWRSMPHDYPPWSTVHSFYFRAKKSGLWEKIQQGTVKKVRAAEGRKDSPGYAIIDSQSVKTVYASEKRGFDDGKKSEGQETPHSS